MTMTTIAERIAQLRIERETVSNAIEPLLIKRLALSREIFALERAITPTKVPAAAKPDDVLMKAAPATLNLKPNK